ncbi:hypothetical protein CGCFRS4_v015933 [Colletotrichum fructicola]|nr:hypothetical protein CGCFRS4_v015933 [Colletotrichum fructicola]
MLTVLTIFLIALNFSHAYAVLTPSERSRLASVEKRALTSWVSMTKGSDWPCSSSQLKDIEKSIEYAKILANGAMVALDNTGTSSKAYVRWFGKTNTNKAQLSTIKTSHFGAPNRFLQTPSSTVKSYDEGGPNSQRLVYACPPKDFPLCNGGVAAAAINSGDQMFKVPIGT